MLIKTGDVKIIDIIKQEEDDDKRKKVLTTALDKAKQYIDNKKMEN